jgi:endonuclease/exonuclease/phosphatase family metal-dependent hydrolase
VYGDRYVRLNRGLSLEFRALLAAADWDLALLQEVPPRWAGPLGDATAADQRRTLTSRNWMRPLTALPARRRPHLVGSWEGGSNLLLVRKGRPGTKVLEHRSAVLCRRPERRVVSMVRLEGGLCVANLHASTGVERAARDVRRAAGLVHDWAGASPLVLGGDFNLRPSGSPVFGELRRTYGLDGVTDEGAIDHLLIRGAERIDPGSAWPDGRRDVPDRDAELMVRLSDHAPVVSRISA